MARGTAPGARTRDPFGAFRDLSRADKLIFVAAFAWGATATARFWRYTYDDVFIVLRYGWNIAAGRGFVFDPGGRVEGTTSFLWVALAAIGQGLGASPLGWLKRISAISGAALPWLVLSLERSFGGGRPSARGAVLICLCPALAVWSSNGLEGTLQAGLLTAALLAAGHDLADPRPFPRAAPWFAIACLVRPETPLLVLPYLAFLALRVRGRRARASTLALAAALPAATVLALTAWRLVNFGVPVPNTYFAKVTNHQLWHLSGWRYLVEIGATPINGLLLLLAGLGAAAGAELERLTAMTVLAQVAAIITTSGDWMEGDRYLVPVLPALAALAGRGLARAQAWADSSPRLRPPHPVWWTAVALAVFAPFALKENVAIDAHLHEYQSWVTRVHRAAARWIVDRTPPESTIALSDCGRIPYLTGHPTIDLLGLNDARIAHSTQAELLTYVLDERKPDLIILTSHEPEPDSEGRLQFACFPAERWLSESPRFHASYVPVAHWSDPVRYGLHLYARRNIVPSLQLGP